MTMLRNRLLVTLVLAAVSLAAFGTGVASARTPLRRNPTWVGTATTSRPSPGRFTGEPDPSGSGSPCPPKTTNLVGTAPTPGLWWVQQWIQWRTGSPVAQHPTRH